MFSPRLILVSILLVAGIFGCTKNKSGSGDGMDVKDTLRINLMSEPPSLDWNKATDTTSSMVLTQIMDTMVGYNLADPELNLTPSLATEWEASNGAKTWTFTLRSGVKWTDGVELTAQHVLDGWERLLAPATASEYAYFLFPVKGAQNFNGGKSKDFASVGAKINDKGQIVVELEKPMGYFPMLLTHHSTTPIRKDVIEKFGDNWTDPKNIVTLGAYSLKAWEHDKSITLERNEAYWGEKAKIKYVVGYMINEFSTALNLFESGKLDFQETIPYIELPKYRKHPGFRQVASLSIYYYGFNTRKPPFNNIKVREAFSMAIDRKQITDLLAGGQQPLSGWVPAGMFGHLDEVGLKFDPEKASKILDAAGFKDRKKLPKVTLGFNTNENHQRIAENVQAQIKKNLGVEIQVSNEEWKVYLNRLKTDTPNIFRLGWLADYPDPDNFMNLMTSYSDNNHTGWKNKSYDALIEDGASQLDQEKRRKIYADAQKLLTQTDIPVFPVFSDMRPLLLSDRVTGFPLNSLNRWELKRVSFK